MPNLYPWFDWLADALKTMPVAARTPEVGGVFPSEAPKSLTVDGAAFTLRSTADGTIYPSFTCGDNATADALQSIVVNLHYLHAGMNFDAIAAAFDRSSSHHAPPMIEAIRELADVRGTGVGKDEDDGHDDNPVVRPHEVFGSRSHD